MVRRFRLPKETRIKTNKYNMELFNSFNFVTNTESGNLALNKEKAKELVDNCVD